MVIFPICNFDEDSMHIVVSWDIAAGPKRTEIEQAMIAALGRHPWARPLTTFYVIPATAITRNTISEALLAVANVATQKVEVLISPLMTGPYAGRHDDWTTINKYTSN
jgi:hypothetical protein